MSSGASRGRARGLELVLDSHLFFSIKTPALGSTDAAGTLRPLVAHSHLGLGKLHRRNGHSEQAYEHLTIATTMHREMDMSLWLARADSELNNLA
jgi:hypothetical protein